ncbi:MAG TPA: hypothetical protein VH062_32740 [Polyangiaceae bacterium]|jgi:hypothetical protein|nr:hypothetical protein [Polyangiaceae bacterium]
MIGRLLGSTDLKQLASFVTPAFFEVMPAKPLFAQAKRLRAASKDAGAMRHAVARRQPLLEQASLPIVLGSREQAPAAGVPSMPAEQRAEAIVTLYFHELLTDGPVLLDLRSEAFTAGADRLFWHPSSWLAAFSPEFVGALRRIYRGFYTANDAEFRAGLDELNLLPAEDLFRTQFGSDVHAVTFRTQHFVSTFHDVFVRCKEKGIRLHPDFLPLGIELAALYEHVESLGVSVDVAKCFERASKVKAAA